MEKKQAYHDNLIKLVSTYPSILVVQADNVGSHHMQKIRKSIRGAGVLLMGKNTMIRRTLRMHKGEVPALDALLPHLKGKIGLVFTKDNLSAVRAKLLELKVAAPAKAGSIAPIDVIVPAGNTGMEPTKTSFLQALNIPSKINKGQVEIVNDVHLIKAGDKVGTSEATLLQMLNIKPFFYGLQVKTVYDNGVIYSAKVLDMTDDDILAKFRAGLQRVAAVSLATGIPTVAAFPHVVLRGYKDLLAVALATEITFKQVQKLKDMIANPDAFKAAAPAAAASSSAPAAAAKPVEEEKEEEEEVGGMGGLFGDDE
jgi:large subunit ribosomal protein LP0